MVLASFEPHDNVGTLIITTHFNETYSIICDKKDDEFFRLGGTGANDVMSFEGLILNLPEFPTLTHFKAFQTPQETFEGKGLLSLEEWSEADLHCYVTEYYPLDMEEKKHQWFISKRPIKDANQLFINLDVTDGGGNLIKRYRVSPFFCGHKVIYADNR